MSGNLFGVLVGYVVGAFTGNWWLFATGIYGDQAARKADRQRRRDTQAYNSSLQDRLEMLDLQPDAPRTLVLGRVRAVEGVRRRWTSGTNDEKLTMIVSLAGHEIDAVEQWYLDDKLVTLDASGWVQEEPYRRASTDTKTATGTTDAFGTAVITLPETPDTGSVTGHYTYGAGESQSQGDLTLVSVVGTVVTVTAASFSGATATVVYTVQNNSSYVRIRPYLGTAGQNVGAALAAEYPGKITSADKFSGIALAVVDVIYSQDVFPQGRPTVTAVMRGAKCFDPRTSTTVWTENPALHALHYATWAHGWALDSADYASADIIAAANACDVSTVFTLRDPKSPSTPATTTLPRHRCGIVIAASADHARAMDDIVDTMAGRHGWAGGVWRLRAGTVAASVASIDQTWLVSNNSDGGRPDTEPVITAAQSVPRAQRINRVTGSFVDPFERWQTLPYPAVQDAVLIAAEGERPIEITYPGVNHIAHAQHLASVAIRQAQAGLRLELTCDERAGALELFDVVELTMPRYGFSAKTFEVIGWTWAQAGAYKIQLAEITEAIYEPLAELQGRDPAPDSDIRPSWLIGEVTGLAVTSGTTGLQDGSILTRTSVTWDAITGESVRQGGTIEVQYALTDADLTLDWPSWVEAGTATGTVIPGLMAGRNYVFRARAVQGQPLVRGKWCATVMHQVADVPVVAGGAGQYKAFVFKRSATAPATPTGDTPAGWSDAPPAADGNVLWVSVADKNPDGSLIAPGWSAPVQIEGAGVTVEYSVDGTTGWHAPWVTGDLYARYTTDGVNWDGPWRIVGEDGSDGADGADGAAAQTLRLTADGFAFAFADASATTAYTPASVTFAALLQNVTGTATFNVTAYNAAGSSLGTGITLGGSGNTGRTLTAAQFVTYAGTRYIKVSATLGALSDTMTVYRGDDGSDAIQAVLSNEAHILPTTAAGVVTDTGSGTTIRVFEGVNELDYDGSGAAAGKWTVSRAVTTGTVSTPGTISESLLTAVVADHAGMSTDAATITYTITGKTATGASFSLTKVQSLAKSNQGATGAAGAGKTCYITSNQALVVGFDAAKAKIATGNNYFNLSANVVNIPGTKTYAWTATTLGTGTQTTATTTNWTWTKESTYTEYPVKIQLVVSEGGIEVASDTVFVTTTLDGSGGISAALSNEAHTFPASSTGAVSDYAGSGTEIRVYEGGVALTYDGSGATAGTWTFSSSATNITRGSITDSGTYATIGVHSGVADGTDTSSITYSITGKTLGGVSFSVPKSQTFSKSKAGGSGSTGQSNHRVYKAVTIGSPPANPGTTTSGATPSTWSATPLTLTTGQEQYQSDGTTPAGSTTTTWATPYQSYLKVGNLSAISADMGTITAGTITGATIRTAVSGARVELSGSTLKATNSGGSNLIEFDNTGKATFAGSTTTGSAVVGSSTAATALAGAATNTSVKIGFYGYGSGTLERFGVVGECNAGAGGAGVWGYGNGTTDAGVRAEAATGYGLDCKSKSIFRAPITLNTNAGVAPMVLSSTYECTNLNAALLKGNTWAAPGAIGGTTPGAGTFTTLIANGNLVVRGDAAEGGQIVLGYQANTTAAGQVNSTWNVDVSDTNAFRIFRQNSSGVALEVMSAAESTGLVTLSDLRINKAPTTGSVAASFTSIVSNKPTGSVAGSEAKWLAINLNGTTYYIPVWT